MLDLPADLTIQRLRELVAEAGDRALLATGTPTPDAKVLELCAEGVEIAQQRDRATEAWRHRPHYIDNKFVEDVEGKALGQKLRPILVRAAKMPAKTPAGLYAKVLLSRAAKTVPHDLFQSVCRDILNQPEIRMAIWPADWRF